ncbi:hypothetical protein [Halotalea alkalilenta]|uniref:Uncharacterized protein n=1 Tax=Halotalea alkalilenta TaxID=376489 RepID=A0A172YC41_9GAMM|nr:hypothetical protein [Halotalea alkalilenta]ANF56575.1 hypothetical protein A5892_03065 [Halotalea alkalilenta]
MIRTVLLALALALLVLGLVFWLFNLMALGTKRSLYATLGVGAAMLVVALLIGLVVSGQERPSNDPTFQQRYLRVATLREPKRMPSLAICPSSDPRHLLLLDADGEPVDDIQQAQSVWCERNPRN